MSRGHADRARRRVRGDEPGIVDLRSLELRPGEARSLEVPVEIGDLMIAGEPYATDPSSPVARVEVSQSSSGWYVRMRVATALTGPCWRCLAPATVVLDADMRDYAAFGRDPGGAFDEDLDSEYLAGDRLDIGAMARDGLLDLIPATILCRDECAGLCASCGADRNVGACSCAPAADPRWSGLEQVAERLRAEG